MEFFLEANSELPPHVQIQEQIKLALLLGRLRPGDTLPSIRDVEKQVGVSRNIVRKSYLALQRAGILTLRHGKGVLVEDKLSYSRRSGVMERSEKLSREVLAKVEHIGISPSAFARYLYQQARQKERTAPSLIYVDATKSLALERAAKISVAWHVNVPGSSMEELAALDRADMKRIRTILTNYLRYDQVRKIVGRTGICVIPLSFFFTQSMKDEFHHLPSKASVVLVLDDRDYPSLGLILESYRQILIDSTVRLAAMPRSRVRNWERFIKSDKYHKMIISNRLWEEIPARLKKHPRVTRPQMEIDLASLESARIGAGVIM